MKLRALGTLWRRAVQSRRGILTHGTGPREKWLGGEGQSSGGDIPKRNGAHQPHRALPLGYEPRTGLLDRPLSDIISREHSLMRKEEILTYRSSR